MALQGCSEAQPEFAAPRWAIVVSDVNGHVGVQPMAAVDLYALHIRFHAADGGQDRFSQLGQWDARGSKEDDFE